MSDYIDNKQSHFIIVTVTYPEISIDFLQQITIHTNGIHTAIDFDIDFSCHIFRVKVVGQIGETDACIYLYGNQKILKVTQNSNFY